MAGAVFHSAFERWSAEGSDRDFGELVRDALGELSELTATLSPS